VGAQRVAECRARKCCGSSRRRDGAMLERRTPLAVASMLAGARLRYEAASVGGGAQRGSAAAMPRSAARVVSRCVVDTAVRHDRRRGSAHGLMTPEALRQRDMPLRYAEARATVRTAPRRRSAPQQRLKPSPARSRREARRYGARRQARMRSYRRADAGAPIAALMRQPSMLSLSSHTSHAMFRCRRRCLQVSHDATTHPVHHPPRHRSAPNRLPPDIRPSGAPRVPIRL